MMNGDKKADRLAKKLLLEQKKRIQPRECEKYVRLVLDSRIKDSCMGSKLILQLEAQGIRHVVRPLAEKYCIVWERSVSQQKLAFDSNNCLSDVWEMEKQLIRLFSQPDFEYTERNNSFGSIINSMKDAYPTMRITLIIPTLPPKSHNTTQLKRETLVTELQVYHEINVLQVNPQGMALIDLLKRFNKAVAQIPYKKEKDAGQKAFKKFLLNDNRNCIHVKDHHGLYRLWQQHLNRLPLITLDVAEAIGSQFSCPKKLLDCIEHQSDPSGIIADIKITRGPEVSSTNRRIGKAMGSKLVKLYQTTNPNELL